MTYTEILEAHVQDYGHMLLSGSGRADRTRKASSIGKRILLSVVLCNDLACTCTYDASCTSLHTHTLTS